MSMAASYAEAVYAGVLGKIIGVYLGRPVEGWAYEDIARRCGEILYYVNRDIDVPLIVADDDISGTFGFARAVPDHDYPRSISAEAVGDTWLNYIIEHKTVLWWGGLGRSTEHTAYLRLKDGIPAPRSGTAALNGRTLSEQIGAQIFIDAFAMMNPGDPERAAAWVREAASVSHDGLAVEAAVYLGVMEALAFEVTATEELLECGMAFVHSPFLLELIEDVVGLCKRASDWREVRRQLDERYGPSKYPGPCHIVTNHASVLAALVLGGDSFQRSIMIAASAGWDTDCNAGSVGCLNGIRLGLDAITADVDFRLPVADRLLVVTSDGGSCVSDAVQEARKIVTATAHLRGDAPSELEPRFTFEYRGSTQGFEACPYAIAPYANVLVRGQDDRGLVVECYGVGPGSPATVSTPVFIERRDRYENFSTPASPTLYSGQEVRMRLSAGTRPPAGVRLYVIHRDDRGEVCRTVSDLFPLETGSNEVRWRVPPVGNNPLIRVGVQVESTARFDGRVVFEEIHWVGAPVDFSQDGLFMSSIWDTKPEPLSAWVSSAETFEADTQHGYVISHPQGVGLVTLGTSDWDDYTVGSALTFGLHRSAGVVVRATGHRRHYAAVFSGDSHVALVKRNHGDCVTLAEAAWSYEHDRAYDVLLEARGDSLHLAIDGRNVLSANDNNTPLLRGGAGFLIDEGTLLADGFRIAAVGMS